MPDMTLTAMPVLGGYKQSFDGIDLAEAIDLAIVSVALPLGGEDAVREAVKKAYGTKLPAVGQSVLSKDDKSRLVVLGQDLAFVIFNHGGPDARDIVAGKIKDTGYTTDQTDVWVGLEISGANARTALERICPIDLDPGVFAENQAARTTMEHLGTLIIRTGADAFLIMSASSSAGSFLHAVETSVKNVS